MNCQTINLAMGDTVEFDIKFNQSQTSGLFFLPRKVRYIATRPTTITGAQLYTSLAHTSPSIDGETLWIPMADGASRQDLENALLDGTLDPADHMRLTFS